MKLKLLKYRKRNYTNGGNKAIGKKSFVDSVWTENAKLKDKVLLCVFAAFRITYVRRSTANSHVQTTPSWFKYVLIVSFDFSQMFAEVIT